MCANFATADRSARHAFINGRKIAGCAPIPIRSSGASEPTRSTRRIFTRSTPSKIAISFSRWSINWKKRAAVLCADLDCVAGPLTYTLKLNSGVDWNWPVSDDGREIRFVSPRVMGVYEDATPLGDEGLNLIFLLTWSTVQQVAYGQTSSYTDDRASSPLLWAISNWPRCALLNLPYDWSAQVKAELQTQPLALEALWNPPHRSELTPSIRMAYASCISSSRNTARRPWQKFSGSWERRNPSPI